MFDMLTRRWWTFAVQGVAALVFGVLTLVWPGLSLAVLIALFGAVALVRGVMALAASYNAHKRHLRWGSWLAIGLLDVVAGLVAWFWPGLTALALLYVVAAWAIVTGVMGIVATIEFHRAIRHAWLLALSGALSLALGVVLVVNPLSGILSLLWLIGVYAIVAGLAEVVFAVRVRLLRRDGGQTVSRLTHAAG